MSSISTRIAGLPVLNRMASQVDATHFNAIRLGILRLGAPLRIAMTGLKHLDMVLENQLWVCVDNSLNDFPIIAWMNFAVNERAALHDPVRCEIRFYHSHAGMIMKKLLDITQREIEGRLEQPSNR